MSKIALAFLIGVLILTAFEELPNWLWVFGAIPVLIVGVIIPRSMLIVALLLGFFWAVGHAHIKLYPRLDKIYEGTDLLVSGEISSIPTVQARSVRFEFDVHSANLNSDNSKVLIPKKVRLSWYGSYPEIHLGERWNFTVRLKRPWRFANPGSFDYEKWLFENEIGATGYVRNTKTAKKINATNIKSPTKYIRYWLNNKLQKIQLDDNESIVKALLLGHRSEISSQRQKILTGTGTSHLMAISGLHVGLVSGLVYLLVFQVWKQSERLCMTFAAQRVAALSGITASIFYAMLAGFSIPTQRAMIMATVVFASIYFMKSLRVWNILSLALLCVLLWDPFSVLSPGFWLSFIAVALIFLTIKAEKQPRSRWLQLVHIQLVLALGLFPLTIYFFQQAALVSPIANLFAVPWVSFVTVPLVIMGSGLLVISDHLGALVLGLASHSITILWIVLKFLYNLPYATWQHSSPDWALIPAVIGVALLLLPKGWPSKSLSLVLFSPLVFANSYTLKGDDMRLSVLDVGQGLAAVIEIKDRVLVYDTGPAYSDSFNAGESVVVPYLRERGINKIDMLIVSHSDKDHAGGLDAVMKNLQVDRLVTSNPKDFKYPGTSPCRQGISWAWEDVEFQFLHPTSEGHKISRNNRSCVLLIRHPAGSVLMTGDIERQIERKLVENQPDIIDTDVLVVPHHGSNSSSTKKFIHTTSPKFAVIAAGYRNPYGFPKENVVLRYEKFGTKVINTASQGMVSFLISNEQGIRLNQGFRSAHRKFWHSRV